MIDVEELKDGIYYGEARNKFSYFILVKSPYRVFIPFYMNITGDITYNYNCNYNTYLENLAKLITKKEFYEAVARFKEEHNVKHIYIKRHEN